MKRTINSTLSFLPYSKWLLAVLYSLLAWWAWCSRDNVYTLVPMLRATPLGNLPLDLLLFTLLLLGLICLATLLYRPPLTAKFVNNAFVEAGLKNGAGIHPTLYSVRRDRDREHGKVFRVRSEGIPPEDFDSHTTKLQASLGGKIYCIAPGGTFKTDIYFLPQRYAQLPVFSPDDDAIGAIGLDRLINLLVIGPTGTGKSVAIKIFMSKILKYRPDSTLWLLDFKQMDFQKFSSCSHYYGYTDCLQGLKDYYAAFKAQQAAGVAGVPNYLIIDEWGSFITSLDKKDAEQAKRLLAELLMLGRAYHFIPIIGIQRPDASYFNGSRDNFNSCLALGNLSPEGQHMLFPDSVKEQVTMCKQREGHLYIDGVGLEKIRIENIADIDALDTSIREAMSR